MSPKDVRNISHPEPEILTSRVSGYVHTDPTMDGPTHGRSQPHLLTFLCLEFLNWAKLDEVMKYLAFLQIIIFQVPIFKPKIICLTF